SDHGGRAGREPPRRFGGGRIGVRLARPGAARVPEFVRARFQPSAGDLLPLGLPGGGREPGRRSGLSRARPAHQGGLKPMPKSFWGRFVRNRPAVFGLAFLAFVVLLALGAPLLFPGDPFRIVGKTFLPPFGDYLFGTDSLGRDIAAGIAHGGRTSLMVGLVATFFAVSVGTLLGALAGFYRGWIDDMLMRFTEF